MTNWWQKLRLDPFLVIMITVVILASLFPATGSVATGFRYLTTAAIALLFFFHGAKLAGSDCHGDGALASASDGVLQYFYPLPAAGAGFTVPGTGMDVSDHLHGFLILMRLTGDSTIGYRLYLCRGRKCGGGDLQCIRLQYPWCVLITGHYRFYDGNAGRA